ncbi:MAG: Holliday junction branch migration protein RuvA [candidate division WOR-3 bacterium]
MIGALRGRLLEKEPTRIVIECSGIGFELRVPLSTSGRLPDAGQEAQVLVLLRVTRSGVDLFGFFDREERDAFSLLTSVKGIGPKAGLNLLSRFAPREIHELIASGRVEVFRTVPGIGPKKAESILKKLQGETPTPEPLQPMLADAQSALMSLGLTRKEARERLSRVQLKPGMMLGELLKLCLSMRVQ